MQVAKNSMSEVVNPSSTNRTRQSGYDYITCAAFTCLQLSQISQILERVSLDFANVIAIQVSTK
jgi:hypothetical protein